MTARDSWRAYHEAKGNMSLASTRLGIPRNTLRYRLERGVELFGASLRVPHVGGSEAAMEAEVRALPKKGEVRRFICTSAQSNTHLNQTVWSNLTALAEYLDAEILVSRFTYRKQAYGELSVKPGTFHSVAEDKSAWFAEEIEPYICDWRVELAPGLVWCGEVQMLPTARRPLTGFEDYAGRKSTIVPHPKLALKSVPSGKNEGTKILFTTGTVTERNYIQRREGLRAERWHTYGALLVEVDSEGDWFCRQLVAGEDGSIQDLDLLVSNGEISLGNRVEAITWGDVHPQRIDPTIEQLSWGPGGMLDTLRPRQQHLHDLLDFETRTHHNRKDPHEMFWLHTNGRESVEDELRRTSRFLDTVARDWCTTYVPDANHNRHLTSWLKETDAYRHDHVNSVVFLELQLALYKSMRDGDVKFKLVEHALGLHGGTHGAVFLGRDESLILLHEVDGGIECGMHGDDGPNGSRGAPLALSRMGRRANTAHTHTTEIVDGLYVAGTSALLDMRFNHGPSSWTHSHIVTYPNGTRAIVTMWNGKWRADRGRGTPKKNDRGKW